MADYKIAFDCKLRRPGCVLIQAGLGGLSGALFSDYFPEETWLLFPTDDMAVYPVTEEQLAILSEMAKNAIKNEGRTK